MKTPATHPAVINNQTALDEVKTGLDVASVLQLQSAYTRGAEIIDTKWG